MLIILTFPMASRPLSNNNKTPRNRKNIPKPAIPTPSSKNLINSLGTFTPISPYFIHKKKKTINS